MLSTKAYDYFLTATCVLVLFINRGVAGGGGGGGGGGSGGSSTPFCHLPWWAGLFNIIIIYIIIIICRMIE